MNINKVTIIVFFLILHTFLFACTVISASNDSIALAGGNKDWNNTRTKIKVIPSSEDKLGIVYFGYQITEGFQNVCGINAKGLCYDGASLPERYDISNVHNKPVIEGEICERALERCSSVSEVITLYTRYFSRHWNGHSMWSDADGNSVIIEYGEDDVVFITDSQPFQVMTNHYLWGNIAPEWNNCYRYKIATEMLTTTEDFSIDLFTEILAATHQTGFNPTLFSNVYDLTNRKVYIYNFHEYGERVILDVDEELAKGSSYYDLPALFNQIRLQYPADNAVISSEEIEFVWFGNAESYYLQYSDGANVYEDLITDQTANRKQNMPYELIPGLLMTGSIAILRKKEQTFLLFLLLMGFFISCSLDTLTSPYPKSDIRHTASIDDLSPGNQYSWKVIAVEDNSIRNESAEFSFTVR